MRRSRRAVKTWGGTACSRPFLFPQLPMGTATFILIFSNHYVPSEKKTRQWISKCPSSCSVFIKNAMGNAILTTKLSKEGYWTQGDLIRDGGAPKAIYKLFTHATYRSLYDAHTVYLSNIHGSNSSHSVPDMPKFNSHSDPKAIFREARAALP